MHAIGTSDKAVAALLQAEADLALADEKVGVEHGLNIIATRYPARCLSSLLFGLFLLLLALSLHLDISSLFF